MRPRGLGVLGWIGLAGCTMPNPAFDPHAVADESAGETRAGDGDPTGDGDPSGDGDGDPSGDGDGDPSGDGDGDPSGDGDGDGDPSGDGDGDGDGCGDQLMCDGMCVDPNTADHCGSCDPCEGECIDQVCVVDHVMFLTNAYYAGSLGGIEGANAICQEAANNGVVASGEYIAWLGAEGDSPVGQFDAGSRFVRPDGQVIATSLAELLDGSIDAKIIITEQNMTLGLGEPCNPYALVWTGLTPTGEPVPDGNCQNWTSTAGGGGTGFAHAADGNWAMSLECNQGVSACTQYRKLYCVQL